VSRAVACGCGLALAALAGSAFADEPASARLSPHPLWELGLGVGVLDLPDYRGSDHSQGYLLPVPYVVYRGDWLKADREGARALLLKSERIDVDLSASAGVPAHSRDNDARRGMEDLPASVELGPNLQVRMANFGGRRDARLDLRVPLRAAFTVERSPRDIGFTLSPNLNLDLSNLAGGWHLGLLTGPFFASQRYHQHYYGVRAADATPQRPAYEARGGYGGWQALAATSRRFGNTWVGAFVRFDDLHGAVYQSSPLVRRSYAVAGGIAVAWVFAQSGRIVQSED
jgi:MipA family protein